MCRDWAYIIAEEDEAANTVTITSGAFKNGELIGGVITTTYQFFGNRTKLRTKLPFPTEEYWEYKSPGQL